jgi:hypothetical protein
MKWIFSILLLSVSSISFGQGFTYSYVDPCSKKLKVINIPNASSTVTVNYLGYVSTFTKDDFDNGNFAGWVGDLSTKYASAPCDEVKTKTQVSQNTIITQNIISTLSSVTSVSTMTVASTIGGMSSNGLSNSVDNSSSGSDGKSSGKSSGKNDQNNTQSGTNTTENGGNSTQSGTNTGNIGQNNPNSGSNSPKNEPQTPKNEPQTGNNPQTPQTGENTGNSGSNTGNSGSNPGSNTGNTGQNGENTENPGSNTGNSGGNGSNSGNSGGNSGNSGGNGSNSGNSGGGNGTAEPKNDPATPKTDDKSGGNGGTTNSVANAAESSSSGGSGGGKPSSKTTAKTGSIIGTGDIVVIRSAEDNSNQFRATMSMTKSNTDNSKSKGALLNFTTTINNSNLTFYTALTNKKKTNTAIFANSSMIDFERNLFNTTTALESHRYGRLSLMGGANFTVGSLSDEVFTNLSAVGGGFYMFKVGKKVNANILMLAVYSPFTKFYEGRWWNSGVLLVPFSSWDYGISKNFKFNVSFSGTYQYSDKFLNYQILTGGKIML